MKNIKEEVSRYRELNPSIMELEKERRIISKRLVEHVVKHGPFTIELDGKHFYVGVESTSMMTNRRLVMKEVEIK